MGTAVVVVVVVMAVVVVLVVVVVMVVVVEVGVAVVSLAVGMLVGPVVLEGVPAVVAVVTVVVAGLPTVIEGGRMFSLTIKSLFLKTSIMLSSSGMFMATKAMSASVIVDPGRNLLTVTLLKAFGKAAWKTGSISCFISCALFRKAGEFEFESSS